MLKEFRDFLMRGNIVDLAVAVVIGAAFTDLVNALVRSFITPLISVVLGKNDFLGLSFTVSGTTFVYGDFLNALIAFVLIAAVVFFAVVKPMNALSRGKTEPEAPSEDIQLLTDIRDELRTQRAS
ncbi:MAG: large conductance mechanosensitive channel protein MscL [Solirubrobacteraceae bacterium]|nr:large conductance mechanosensitive channel protein MscL [Solirubrobacteraceae bacterium]